MQPNIIRDFRSELGEAAVSAAKVMMQYKLLGSNCINDQVNFYGI